MLLEEFDVKKYERTLREEGREEGRKEEREEAKQRKLELLDRLLAQDRIEDARLIKSNEEYLDKLYREFGL